MSDEVIERPTLFAETVSELNLRRNLCETLDSRLDDLRSGKVKGIPVEQVMKEAIAVARGKKHVHKGESFSEELDRRRAELRSGKVKGVSIKRMMKKGRAIIKQGK